MVQTPPDALAAYRQALTHISGNGGSPLPEDFEIGRDLMAKTAPKFPPAAAHLAALDGLQIGGRSSDTQTAETYVKAAMSGFPPAVRGLGCVMLQSGKGEGIGAGLLRRAAQAGDWVAAFLILRESQRGRWLASPKEMARIAGLLSETVPFRSEFSFDPAQEMPDAEMVAPDPFRQESCIAALIEILQALPIIAPKMHCDHPLIFTRAQVLSPLECDYLIAGSHALMRPSKVVDAEAAGAVSAGYRTSDGAVMLPANMDLISVIITRKLSHAAGIKPEQGEFLSLLRYRPGQEYLPHHDFLKEDAQDYSLVHSCGQRKRTLLTYLNAGYTGGETAFPDLELTFKGGIGDCLRFENVTDAGEPIETSLHAGLPVTSGEKWLATLWCREKNFWPWMRGA